MVAFDCCLWLLCVFTLVTCGIGDDLEGLSKDLACGLERPEWQEYHTAYDRACRATATNDEPERAAARAVLAESLAKRTGNISDVLSCNVGVIAGYFIIARLASPLAVESQGYVGAADGEAGLAYRLLQLALIFIFTLRNANRIPADLGRAWGVGEQSIIPAIMEMKKGQDHWMRRNAQRVVPIAPSFRDPSLRIAVVSICAYPPDHPLVLSKVTPLNRDAYTRQHDYALRLHMEPPVIGAHGLGVQHAKLATVLSYLQSGEFDWVAWLDCDSIIMNMDRTLDSIIYQYTQQKQEAGDAEPLPVCGSEGDVTLSGQWHDSWMSPEMRDEAAVNIVQSRDGSVEVNALQFGSVTGRWLDGTLELDFPDGPLSARVHEDEGSLRLAWENGAEWTMQEAAAVPACRKPCYGPDEDCNISLDPEIDFLVTEEGWGLSSANWLIRRSKWSMDFMHDALTAAHAEMNLFGDQDAMILHLMNQQALGAAADVDASSRKLDKDPLDRHAAIVPQFELNSYDALNALTMDCDMFVEGDLLVTFPQCKDAEGCNDVFNIATKYADDKDKPKLPDAGAWWRRLEGQPRWSGYDVRASAALRVFGPRPVIRDVFLRERARDQEEDDEV